MKRHIFLFICIVLLTGCGISHTATTENSSIPLNDKASVNSTHTVTDCSGRNVQIPDEIDSVSCLYAFAGHACVVLGQEEKLSSVVNGLKRDLLMQRKLKNIEELPVPYNNRAINIEELLASDPDVVLLREESLVNNGELEKLEKSGLPYVVIDYGTMEEQS